ncbi:MAG: glycosyltransferase [Deltaproteobacteria bacterium]
MRLISANKVSPVFSIIMPVWNRAKTIERSLKSVLSQTFAAYELIIVDDGSEDEIDKVVRPFLSERVRFYKRPRKGLSAARNFGLEQARGKYIAYLDSDNIWHPDFLAKMAQAVNRPFFHAEAAYCQCDRYRKDPNTGNMKKISVCGRSFDPKVLAEENFIDLNTFVHSKKCFKIAGGFNEQLKRLIDWDFILRVTRRFRPVFLKQTLVDYYLDACPNAVTLTEDLSGPFGAIRATHGPRDIRLLHDEICYAYRNVPEKKFTNWVRMSSQCRHDIFHRIEAKTLPRDASSFAAPGYPYILQIEPTNLCNLACPLCPVSENKLTRERRHMSSKEFQAIIDDMQEYLLFLILWDWGEPLMNPDLPEMIKYASVRDIRTVTSTNAHFFTDTDYIERILRSGLTTLIIAIDSLQQDRYKEYRKGGDLRKAVQGLEKLIEIKKKVKSKTLLNLRMVVMKNNEDELQAMRDFSRKIKIDKFTVKTVNPSCGSKSMDDEIIPLNPAYRRYEYDPDTHERIRIKAACERVWLMSNIFSNGDVVPCCYDYNAEQKVGNVFEKPFSQIWNSPAYKELRKKIYLEKDAILKCKECGINFKLSKVGWFVKEYEFNSGIKQRVKEFQDTEGLSREGL